MPFILLLGIYSVSYRAKPSVHTLVTAAVVHDIEAAAPLLAREFQRLAQATNLVLNVSKTICIPLWETSPCIATDKLKAACEQWAEATVADTGK